MRRCVCNDSFNGLWRIACKRAQIDLYMSILHNIVLLTVGVCALFLISLFVEQDWKKKCFFVTQRSSYFLRKVLVVRIIGLSKRIFRLRIFQTCFELCKQFIPYQCCSKCLWFQVTKFSSTKTNHAHSCRYIDCFYSQLRWLLCIFLFC